MFNDSRHKFLLAPMDGISFAELADATSQPIDTGELRLPPGYEIAKQEHTLIYPTRLTRNTLGGETELEIKFRIRRVRP